MYHQNIATTPHFNPYKTPPKHSLGKITKSQSNHIMYDLKQQKKSRSNKYSLQNESQKLLPSERVCNCLRHRIDKSKNVTVRYNENRKTAHYANVQRCGSIWVCPVCAAKVSEQRKQELSTGIKNFRKTGGCVYLLTLTTPHHYGDNLENLLSGQKKAMAYLFGDRISKEYFKSIHKIGHITSLEVTRGKNGWHPHRHILLFLKNPINIKKVQDFISDIWINCCRKAKLKLPSKRNGVDLRGGVAASNYIAKWGVSDEMTKSHLKKGKKSSLTPWDLLRKSQNGCQKSGYLFTVFAKAFKGQRQLSWSRGLKDLLKIDEVDDNTLANNVESDTKEVRKVPMQIWFLLKLYNERANFLSCVEHDVAFGSQRADNLILNLATRYSEILQINANTT